MKVNLKKHTPGELKKLYQEYIKTTEISGSAKTRVQDYIFFLNQVAGFTQVEIADILGISQSWISYVINKIRKQRKKVKTI